MMSKKNIRIILILIICFLISGGSWGYRQMQRKQIENLTMEDMTVRLQGVDFTLYQPLSTVLSEDGWKLNGIDPDDDLIWKNNTCVDLYYQDNNNLHVSLYIYNQMPSWDLTYDTKTMTKWKDAIIYRIDIDSRILDDELQVELPDELEMGNSFETLLEKRKNPYSLYTNGDSHMIANYHDQARVEDYNHYSGFSFYFKENSLYQMSMYSSPKNSSDTLYADSDYLLEGLQNISFYTNDFLGYDLANFQNIAKTAMSDQVLEQGMLYDELKLQSDITMHDFLINGWEISEEKTYSTVMKKGKDEAHISFASEDQSEQGAIDSIEINRMEETDSSMPLDSNIYLPNQQNFTDITEAQLLSVFGLPESYYVTHDWGSDLVTKYIYENRSIQYSFIYKEGRLSKINISFLQS